MTPNLTLTRLRVRMLVMNLLSFFLFFLVSIWASYAHAIDIDESPELRTIAEELIAEGYYSQGELESIFASAQIQESVLKAMKSPAEYKFTWGKYRKLFLQEDRIQQGVDFWQHHEATFTRAEQEYGVPANIIAAIIGVESKFGRYKGSHKVLDSLVSLVVEFPRRRAFFAKELKEFLILAKENQLDSRELLGSYAGAMGYPQFISSSYRNYAVDFSGDGSIDLINQPVDAIGSVANYFVENGWLSDQPITSKAYLSVSPSISKLANRKRKIQYTAEYLAQQGAQIASSVPMTEKLNVLMLDASETVHDPSTDRYYIVRSGDTACEIAERYNVSCKKLISLNKLGKKARIFRDQKLKLPVSAKQNSVDAGDKWQVDRDSSVQPRYFYTHENFYVITRYNHSVLYAMAVHDLSNAIAIAMNERKNTVSVR